MNILETKISYFKNTKNTEVSGEVTIKDILLKFEGNEGLSNRISELRNNPEKSKAIKQSLPTFAMHGVFSYNRKKSNFVEASGLIILDIDDVDVSVIQQTKLDIMESSDHILSAMTSPSGNGIKVLYYVQPELINADNYRQIGKQLVQQFDIYGSVDYLSVTDCLIATYDEDILINYEATPDLIYVENSEFSQEVELEKRDEDKELWHDAEEFFETVLYNDIVSKTNNAFHFIQVSILDLAKFGFFHPKEDLSFVIDFCESEFNTEGDNKQRFIEITKIANNYSQTRWAYKMTKDEEEEEEFIDYSKKSKGGLGAVGSQDEDGSSDSGSDEEEESGLIDYSSLFDRVVKVAEEGDRVGDEISLENFSNVFRFRGTGILTVTGIPGHGKTEFVDQITVDLGRLKGQETIIAGFEQSPEEHIIKLMRKMVGANITCPSYNNKEEFRQAFEFVASKYKHIDVTRIGGNIHKILDVASDYIVKSREEGRNPRYLVLDPFNMLSIKSKSNGTEKIEQILRAITQFSHQMGILVILIAHPFKMRKDEKTGQYEIPDFYSVKGSSAFFEMSYHGLVVYRNMDNSVMVRVLKVKQNNLGTTNAEVFLDYHKASGRYIPIDEEGNELSGTHYDKDWLDKLN